MEVVLKLSRVVHKICRMSASTLAGRWLGCLILLLRISVRECMVDWWWWIGSKLGWLKELLAELTNLEIYIDI